MGFQAPLPCRPLMVVSAPGSARKMAAERTKQLSAEGGRGTELGSTPGVSAGVHTTPTDRVVSSRAPGVPSGLGPPHTSPCPARALGVACSVKQIPQEN